MLAVLAVAGLSAAYIGPLSASIEPAEAAEPVAVSLYSATRDDAQTYTTGGEHADIGDLGRGSVTYAMELIPTPTPTPEPEPASSSSGSSSGGGAAPLFYTGGGAPAEWMAAAGIAESDRGYVDYIVGRESGWNPNATNSSSGACGLVQALPCSKVPGNGYDPVDNLVWANGYAVGRYGSWAGAYEFWINNHWW